MRSTKASNSKGGVRELSEQVGTMMQHVENNPSAVSCSAAACVALSEFSDVPAPLDNPFATDLLITANGLATDLAYDSNDNTDNIPSNYCGKDKGAKVNVEILRRHP